MTDIVEVVTEPLSVIEVLADPPTIVEVVTPGPPGPRGPSGPSDLIVAWFEGAGPPPLAIPGASPGDMYHDNTDHRFYQLQ